MLNVELLHSGPSYFWLQTDRGAINHRFSVQSAILYPDFAVLTNYVCFFKNCGH